MIPCVLEKIGYGAAVLALVMQGRMHRADLLFAGTDLLLGLLFCHRLLQNARFRSCGAMTSGGACVVQLLAFNF